MTNRSFIQSDFALSESGLIAETVTFVVEDGILVDRVPKFICGHAHETHDYQEKTVLIPPLTNAHCHLELSQISLTPQSDFFLWVSELIQKKNSPNYNPHQAIKHGVDKLYREGVRTIFNHHSFDTPVTAYENVSEFVINIGEVLGLSLQRSEEIYNKFKEQKNKNPSAWHTLSPHAPYSLHEKMTHRLLEEFKSQSIHFLEARDESYFFDPTVKELPQNGITNLLAKFEQNESVIKNNIDQILEASNDFLLIHANHFTNAMIQKIKNKIELDQKICIVHCPQSHQFFSHSDFPYEKISSAGIPVALGTDSSASCAQFSFWEDIRLFKKTYSLSWPKIMPLITKNALIPFHIKPHENAVGHPFRLCRVSNKFLAL